MSESNTNNKRVKTGNKVFDVIIYIILVISVLGIISFTFLGIQKILEGEVFSALPNVMYVLMYVSIIQYIIDFFIKKKKASIHGMLFSYCMLTIMSTLTIPNIANYNIILILALLVIVCVPFMRKDLTNVKRCSLILTLVFILSVVMTILKLYYGLSDLSGDNPFLVMVSVFEAFHQLFVWTIFIILYIIRCKILYDKGANYIEENGIESFLEKNKKEHEKFLEEQDQEKKRKKERRKEKIKSKINKC